MPDIDLHTHSTASDGTLTPTELVAHAREVGLKALALTDHDTVAGVEEALAAGEKYGVEVIPGCEISAETPDYRMHILGLFLPPRPEKLIRVMDGLLEHRHNRNHIIVGRLNDLGYSITYDEIRAIAGEGSVGRPHIARCLMDKHIVSSIQEAFDRFIGPKGKAYEPKKILTDKDAVSILKEEGATVVLAHPYQLGMSPGELEKLVLELMELGLDGIEVYYPEHTPTQTRRYEELAEKHGLVKSGGSDFHGTVKPRIALGRGKNGGLDIPYQVLADIKAYRNRAR